LRELRLSMPCKLAPLPGWFDRHHPRRATPRSKPKDPLDRVAIDRDFIDEEIRGASVVPELDEVRVRGELAGAAVVHFIGSHAARALWCYQHALARRPSLRGRLSVRVAIGGTGKIENATIVASELDDADLERCIAGHALRGYFPAPKDGVVTVTYPLELTPARKGSPPWPSQTH
jgi:hypothetical protein